MLHIIVNPIAGKKRAAKNLQTVERIFSGRGVAYTVHKTEFAGDGEKITRKLCEQGERTFVVVGGDGTLHEVLNGLIDPSVCSLGLVPSGTGNDFAAALSIPLDAEKAALKIADGQATEINYLQVGHRRSMNVAGLGMDVDVLERCLRGKSRGKLKYLKSLLVSLFKFKGYKVRVERDGEVEEHDALIAAACNGSQFGGGIRICPTASVDDGKISVVVVERIGGKWKLIKALMQLMKGKILTYPATTHFLCNKLTVLPENACALQLDGEIYKDVAFEAEIKGGLKFYR